MIADPDKLRRFEDQQIRSEPLNFEQALRIVEALILEAQSLGVWPPSEPLSGIEVDIRIAKILHVQENS